MGKEKKTSAPWVRLRALRDHERLSITFRQNSPCLSYRCFLMVRWLFCTHTHCFHYELIRLAPSFKHYFFLQLKTFLKIVKEKLMRRLAIIIYAQLAYRLGSSAFKDRVRLVAFLLSELWELGILFFQEPPINTEIAHLWLQSHAHHWHKTWKAKLFVARVYYSGTFFCLVSHRSIMLNIRDLKILRRGRPLERVFLSACTWTHVMAGKRDSRGRSTTSFSWKFYDFAIGRGLNFLQ